MNLHFNRIIFPDFCQAQIRGALIVGHGITILTPVKVINLLDALGDKINNTTVTRLNQCLFFHRKDSITFGISIISSVGHCAIGNHIFPNTEPLIQAIQPNHTETIHLPVTTTIGDRYSQAGKMFNLRKLYHEANTNFRIDLSGECKVICGSRPISVKVFRSIADTINSTVTGCTTHVHIAQLYQNVIGNTNELRRIGIQLDQILLSLINRGKYCSCLIGMHRNIM